ncbi:16649_t:CDS:2, partial [Cetraspora pellucida]
DNLTQAKTEIITLLEQKVGENNLKEYISEANTLAELKEREKNILAVIKKLIEGIPPSQINHILK